MPKRALGAIRAPKSSSRPTSSRYASLVFDRARRLIGVSRNAGALLGLGADRLRLGIAYEALRKSLPDGLRRTLPADPRTQTRVARNPSLACLTIPVPGFGFLVTVSSDPDAWAAAELEIRQGIREAALESSRDAVALFDPDDRLVDFNRKMTALLGPNAGLLKPGARLDDIIHELAARGFYREGGRDIDAYFAAHAAQRTEPLHFLYAYADGRMIEALDRRTEDGFTVLVRADITERVERERALSEQNTVLELVLANMSNGITYFDSDGQLQLWNDRYAELLGAPKDELRHGMTIKDVYRLITESGEAPDFSDQGAGAQAIISSAGNTQFRRTNSNGRLIEGRYRSLKAGGGVCTFIDITDIEEARLKLETALDDARRATALKSIFLANVTHELRTPLNAITGFSDLLTSEHYGALNPKQREFVDCIASSGQHLLSLIDGIIDLTRIEAQQTKLDLGPVDLAHLVNMSIRMVEAAQRGRPTASISADLGVEPLTILADDGKLRQILINLIGNAAKFTPPTGKISVRAHADGDGWCAIEVSDTGPGIAPEDLPRVFEPFYRSQSAAVRAIEGNGLGLPLARALAELHGGRLEVRSSVGAGTAVTVRLPTAPPTPPDP